MASTLDVSAARSRFPALQQEQVYMDNAGETGLHFYGHDSFEIHADYYRRKSGSRYCGGLVSLIDPIVDCYMYILTRP